jgi:hypothetical protein
VQVRAVRLDFTHQFGKEFQIHFWMNATYDVYLCYRLAVILFYNINHVLHGQLPPFIAVCVKAGIGAELTCVHANICRLDMEISIEVSVVAVHSLPHMIGKHAKEGETRPLIQHQTIV